MLFERDIKKIKKEVHSLKVAARKSSSIVGMVSESFDLSIGLSLSQGNASGRRTFRISSTDGGLILASPTLDKIYDWSDGRNYECLPYWQTSDQAEIVVVVVNGSSDDVNTLSQGGSVTVNVKLTITATNYFTITEV